MYWGTEKYWEKILLSKSKSKLVKEQEASGLVSILGIKTPLSTISLVGPLLF